ncbi:unnamed protein product [Urochloa humidicola]
MCRNADVQYQHMSPGKMKRRWWFSLVSEHLVLSPLRWAGQRYEGEPPGSTVLRPGTWLDSARLRCPGMQSQELLRMQLDRLIHRRQSLSIPCI